MGPTDARAADPGPMARRLRRLGLLLALLCALGSCAQDGGAQDGGAQDGGAQDGGALIPSTCVNEAVSRWLAEVQLPILRGERPLRVVVWARHKRSRLGTRSRTLRGALTLAILSDRAFMVYGKVDDALAPAAFDWRLVSEDPATADVRDAILDTVDGAFEHIVPIDGVALSGLTVDWLRDAPTSYARLAEEDWPTRTASADAAQVVAIFGWRDDPLRSIVRNPHVAERFALLGNNWDACGIRQLLMPSASLRSALCAAEGAGPARPRLSLVFVGGDGMKRRKDEATESCADAHEEAAAFALCARGVVTAAQASGRGALDILMTTAGERNVGWERGLSSELGKRLAGLGEGAVGEVLWAHEKMGSANTSYFGAMGEVLEASRRAAVVVASSGSLMAEAAVDFAGAGHGPWRHHGICRKASWFGEVEEELAQPAGGCSALPAASVSFRGTHARSQYGFGMPMPKEVAKVEHLCHRVALNHWQACGEGVDAAVDEWDAWFRCDDA